MGKDLMDRLKAFGMTNHMLTEDLTALGLAQGIDLGHVTAPEQIESTFYPQFDSAIRAEAADMAKQYQVFYALEKSARA